MGCYRARTTPKEVSLKKANVLSSLDSSELIWEILIGRLVLCLWPPTASRTAKINPQTPSKLALLYGILPSVPCDFKYIKAHEFCNTNCLCTTHSESRTSTINGALYANEISRQFDDHFYQKFPSDPTQSFKREMYHFLKQAMFLGHINQSEHKYLLTEFPIKPVIYGLPKVHKPKIFLSVALS